MLRRLVNAYIRASDRLDGTAMDRYAMRAAERCRSHPWEFYALDPAEQSVMMYLKSAA